MRVTVVLALIPLLCGASAVIEPVDDNVVIVQLTDRIKTGDLFRVRKAMRAAKAAHKQVVALQLDSPGGDGDAGLELAEFVAKYNVDVILSTRCWSACSYTAMVALGKGNLLIKRGAELGVHQVYDNGSGLADPDWTRRAARRLGQIGAPQPLLDAMVDTPPEGLKTYDYDDLVAMGAMEIEGEWSWWIWE
jgi:hypothetical protein